MCLYTGACLGPPGSQCALCMSVRVLVTCIMTEIPFTALWLASWLCLCCLYVHAIAAAKARMKSRYCPQISVHFSKYKPGKVGRGKGCEENQGNLTVRKLTSFPQFKSRPLHFLGKHCTTELHCQPLKVGFFQFSAVVAEQLVSHLFKEYCPSSLACV